MTYAEIVQPRPIVTAVSACPPNAFGTQASHCVRCRTSCAQPLHYHGNTYCGRCYPRVLLIEAYQRLGRVLRHMRRDAERVYGETAARDVREAIAALGGFWAAELLDVADAIRREMEL